MRIVVDALSARLGDRETYLINLFQALPAPQGSEFLVVAPVSLPLPHDRSDIRRLAVNWPVQNPALHVIWQRWVLPRLLQRLRADVLFVPYGVVWTQVPEGCQLVTMFRNMVPFDRAQRLRYPLGYQRFRNWILERVMLRTMIAADLVIFASDYARQIVEAHAPGRIRRALVIRHGVNTEFRADPAHPTPRPAWLPKEPYLLYVSTLNFYKAQIEVIRGFAAFKAKRSGPEKLILIGPENPNYARLVRKEIDILGLRRDVIFGGMVPYLELPAVYQHALINIFASESENCPNTLLEALAAGRPVLCSNAPPMPEFGGDAALYFNPRSPDELAERLITVADSNTLQIELGARALRQSPSFDWAAAGQQTWNAILALPATRVRSLVIHAPNVHQGGGLALLQGILAAATGLINCEILADSRFQAPAIDMPGINIRRVKPRWFSRLHAEWRLRSLAGPNCVVLCFGNLPPLFRLRARVYLFVQNRYLTSAVTLKGFSLAKQFQIIAERLWLRWCVSNTDVIVVQSPSMQREVESCLGRNAIVIPFAEEPAQFSRRTVHPRDRNCNILWDFVYVASGEPHKNHERLIKAWTILANQKLRPSLCITVSRETFPELVAWIDEQKNLHHLHIDNAAPHSRSEVTDLYRQSRALIYPSLLESLGIPLVEARCAGLPIVASELDYVRDVVDPDETFNPESDVSIARAVMRFLGIKESLPVIVSSRAFLERLLDS